MSNYSNHLATQPKVKHAPRFRFGSAWFDILGLSLTASGDILESNFPALHIPPALDLQRRQADSHRCLSADRRLLIEVGKCNLGSESKCKLVFSRHAESDEYMRWIKRLNHNITKIVVNSGEKLGRHHAVCESRMLANVGREAFKYISYIVENYNSPQNFAPVTVFCQMNPHSFGYNENSYIRDVHKLCLSSNQSSHADILKWGFLSLGNRVLRFREGLRDYKEPAPELFYKLFNSTIDDPYNMKFVPGGCFAVSKENILSNAEEFYYRLLSTGKDKYHAINRDNSPLLGYIYERSWPRIMNSDCEKKEPWCCHIGCNMTAVQEWETLKGTPGWVPPPREPVNNSTHFSSTG